MSQFIYLEYHGFNWYSEEFLLPPAKRILNPRYIRNIDFSDGLQDKSRKLYSIKIEFDSTEHIDVHFCKNRLKDAKELWVKLENALVYAANVNHVFTQYADLTPTFNAMLTGRFALNYD